MSSGTREDFTGPPDPEPCSCDQALALEKERDTFRDMARQRGDLLVSEVERRLAAERACTATTERLYAQARTMIAAESRLAEATALLDTIRTVIADYHVGAGLRVNAAQCMADIERAISATPAQAAEPDPRCPGGCVMSVPGAGIEPACLYCFKRAQAAEPEPEGVNYEAIDKVCLVRPVDRSVLGPQDTDALRVPSAVSVADAQAVAEYPDTIALRECRAELERHRNGSNGHYLRTALESARAERDTAREAGRAEGRSDINKYSQAIGEIEGHLGITRAVPMRETVAAVRALRAERDTALAHIAELERRCSAYERGAADWLETRACVAQAVAELEKLDDGHVGRAAQVDGHYTAYTLVCQIVRKALEALR